MTRYVTLDRDINGPPGRTGKTSMSTAVFAILVGITLSLSLPPCIALNDLVISNEYLLEDPTCLCNVRKTEAFWAFIDTSNMVNILLQWNPSVHDFKSTPWSTVRNAKAPHARVHELNRTCNYDSEIHRIVEYRTMVRAPVFLSPFVSDRKIHQTKDQFIFNCKEDDLLVFSEDCVIDDIPIIPDIEIQVQSVMSHNHHPVAIATLKHRELPWYMRVIQGMLHDEIIAKAKGLWKITLRNLCQCAS
jgi:hypothetical protein